MTSMRQPTDQEQLYLQNVRRADEKALELARVLQEAAFADKAEKPERMSHDNYVAAPVLRRRRRLLPRAR